MRGFSVNIKGRVKNFSLPKNQPLLPLFEAIVNSIHAIEEKKQSEGMFVYGKIIIEIKRDVEGTLPIDGIIPPVEGFIIKDNGIGFNEPNMKSFMESDSTYKEKLGGKGVGRFSWLTVFKKAKIESIFVENYEYVKRSFEFSTDISEIDDILEMTSERESLTIIELCDCMEPYKENIPKQTKTIAMRIIQHCLIYFIAEDCPQIYIQDENEVYNLNEMFNEVIRTDENEVIINIGEEKFRLLHVKAEEVSINGNKLFLCANNRLVDTKELEKYITDLDREIYDKSGFWYVGVLVSEYFDKNVDMNRLSFSIPDGGGVTEGLVGFLTMKQILDAVIIEVEKYLVEFLNPIKETKNKRIKQYVTNEAPQFRHLLKYMKEDVANIKPNLTDDKLDDELYKIKRKFDIEIKAQNKKLLDELNDGVFSYIEYEQRFMKQMEKINDSNGSTLAEYVAHRKVVIDLLEMGIRKTDDGRFQKEKFIHNLIYPMRMDSESEVYENHNLWLIDEKLAYCNYISSDIPFENDNKQERTDIMVLDSPVALSEDKNEGMVFDTITLFELKRPMRNDYTQSNNPIVQLYDYAEKIIMGEAKDKDGRLIRANENTKFYLYAVCDITPKFQSILRKRGFSKTPDGLGYYEYNKEFNAYVEVLPFDKMISDSKKRNKILFEKLGL